MVKMHCVASLDYYKPQYNHKNETYRSYKIQMHLWLESHDFNKLEFLMKW